MAEAIQIRAVCMGPLGPLFIFRKLNRKKPLTTAHPEQAMSDKSHDPNQMTGAAMIVRALIDHGVKHIFGYPGGAVLPIYDELFQQEEVKHILVRHEQGAGHAAEGYARSTGKPGVVLVTSGPGATNMVTPLTDALMDSIPLVCITGQVPTHLIGNDAFQECDTVGITRPCTKHNWLVRDVNDLAKVLHEAFYVASTGRPGPVVVDVPKDVQFAVGTYHPPRKSDVHVSYAPRVKGDAAQIRKAVALLASAQRPVIYSGGGVINSGSEASRLLRELVEVTGFPITSTLMGLGAYPASGKNWLGMLGMHGTYEANMAMHGCDAMLCVGARFDDRITGRIDAFSPGSKKIHIDIDPSIFRSSAMPAMCWAICCRCSRRRRRSRTSGRGGGRSRNGALAIRCPTKRTAISSCRNSRFSGCSRRRAATTSTSPPKSASTRCGRRSSSASRSRTAG
jgi:acetolactate synthase-1/2/3 large subunit